MEDDRESDRRRIPDNPWGTVANPNTADGEIQSISAFARAAGRATGWRRTAARVAAWSALVLIALFLLAGVVIALR
jgi:uncharacterized membrane protein